MDFSSTSLLSGLADRLRFLSARTSVIAQNVANADTPDYSAQDLSSADFRAAVKGATTLKTTNARHIAASPTSPGSAARAHDAPDGDASLTGNRVSLETQMMKMSETRTQYQLATTVYRKGLNMVRLAARGGR